MMIMMTALSKQYTQKIDGKGRVVVRILALSYSVPVSVKKNLIDGKFIPLFKLLPGYVVGGSNIISSVTDDDGSIKLRVGDSLKGKKLCQQPMEFPQMMLSLLKLKDVLGTISSTLSNEIELCPTKASTGHVFTHSSRQVEIMSPSQRVSVIHSSGLPAVNYASSRKAQALQLPAISLGDLLAEKAEQRELPEQIYQPSCLDLQDIDLEFSGEDADVDIVSEPGVFTPVRTVQNKENKKLVDLLNLKQYLHYNREYTVTLSPKDN